MAYVLLHPVIKAACWFQIVILPSVSIPKMGALALFGSREGTREAERRSHDDASSATATRRGAAGHATNTNVSMSLINSCS